MRILVAEFVTGGGMAREPLPPALTHEADLMVHGLLAELTTIPGIDLLTLRDPRLPPVAGIDALIPGPHDSFLSLYNRGLDWSEAAWPTAPETSGALLQLARATVDRGRLLLGCRPDAVALTTSKHATTEALRRAGIAAVPTFSDPGEIPPLPGPWVVKPDDGAGCEGAVQVSDWRVARDLLAVASTTQLVAQPWIAGEALSLSLLCRDGSARLLSVNRQRISVAEGRLSLVALEVNAVTDHAGRHAALASRIAATIPGLWGYIGVDLVDTAPGPVVLEINPRLTTSYCGLARALDLAVAPAVLRLLHAGPEAVVPAARAGVPVPLPLEVLHGR